MDNPRALPKVIEDAVVVAEHPLPDHGDRIRSQDDRQVEDDAEGGQHRPSSIGQRRCSRGEKMTQMTGTDTTTMMKVHWPEPSGKWIRKEI